MLTALRTNPMVRRLLTLVLSILDRPKTQIEFVRDARRYLKFRAPSDRLAGTSPSQRHIECQLDKDSHRVEKGLSLASPRRPFGAAVERRLEALAAEVDQRQGIPAHLHHARAALAALREWNESGTIDEVVSPEQSPLPLLAGEDSLETIRHLFASRHSVRDFRPDIPDRRTLDAAVDLALTTPSVCNREPWRVHFFQNDRVREILALQNGNLGFGHTVPCLAVVTVDTRLFAGSGERNQRWIDGGLFAMSLVLALQAHGLSTCMLNWSRHERDSEALRSTAGIEDPWDIIVLIAVGFGTEGHRVARSPRRERDEVVAYHGFDMVPGGKDRPPDP